jgi:hypothetical protein
LVPLPNGGWRAVLPATLFGDGGLFARTMIGSFEVHDRYFLQLWCDDPAVRRTTVLRRALNILGRRDVTTRDDLDGHLDTLCRQLETDRVRIETLRAYAAECGEYDRVRRIEALT